MTVAFRWWRVPIESAWTLLMLALAAPLAVPALLLAAAAVTSAPRPSSSWALLGVVGPAIPLYLILLPLLPFGVRALRRGWRPRLGPLLAGGIALGAALDLLFYWAGR